MSIDDFIKRSVKLYLEGGHVLKGKVYDKTWIRSTSSNGNLLKKEALVLEVNGHTTLVIFDKVVAYEIY